MAKLKILTLIAFFSLSASIYADKEYYRDYCFYMNCGWSDSDYNGFFNDYTIYDPETSQAYLNRRNIYDITPNN